MSPIAQSLLLHLSSGNAVLLLTGICAMFKAYCHVAAYLAVADEAYGRQIPYAFLERVRDEFQKNWADKSRTAAAHSLDKTFG